MVGTKPESPLVLIGGLGFIGRNIIEVAQSVPLPRSFKITAVDDLSNAAPGHNTLQNTLCIETDYNASEAHEGLSKIMGSRTFVFLAGETRVAESKERPLDFIEANITNPARFVMNVVRTGDHFILASTAGALFDGSFPIRAESTYCPKNFYGASKAAEEIILEKLVELRGASFSIVRMTNVYGKFSERKVSAVHTFIRAAMEGGEVFISGDGNQTRDFVYAGDVALGILKLVILNLSGMETKKVVLFGSAVSTSINNLVAEIEDAIGCALAHKYIENADLLNTEPRDVIVDTSDMVKVLGDKVTPLSDGLLASQAYYSSMSD